jgi:hypothetical protein
MRARGVVSSILAASCCIWAGSPGAWAAKGDQCVRFGVIQNQPTSDFSQGGQTTELDGAIGFEVGYEYGVTERMGIAPTFSSASHDIEIREAPFPDLEGDVDWLALLATANFHVMRRERLDLFLGPTLGYAFWGDLAIDVFPADFETDGEFVYGASAGLDVPFGGGKWGFTAALRYLVADVTPEGGEEIGVDPVQLGAGLAYRF